MDRALDRLDILNVIAQCSHTADGPDPLAFGSLFAEDGTLRLPGGPDGEATVAGRPALVAFASEEMARRRGQPRHHVRNTTFLSLGEDRARTRTYYLKTEVAAGCPPVARATGIFEDDLVRTKEGWRIEERRVIPDPLPSPT